MSYDLQGSGDMAMAAFGFFAVSIVALVLTSAVIAMLYALAVL